MRRSRILERALKLAQLTPVTNATPAVTPSDTLAAKQSCFIINNQALQLYNDVQTMVNSSSIKPGAKALATTLRDLTSQLGLEANKTEIDWKKISGDLAKIKSNYEQIKSLYLTNEWIQKNDYKPMQLIMQAITAVEAYVAKLPMIK
jgi:uncharacterized protein YpuA (DUF1002 family)